MSLLLDHNLSAKLIPQLETVFPGCTHVRLLGLERATDAEIWNKAKESGYTIVTKDSDFSDRLAMFGFPPKVIWIKRGNCSTTDIEQLLFQHTDHVTAFEKSQEVGLLVIE